MAEPQLPQQPQDSAHLRKKKKKNRYLKQGYHKSERDDSRRVAARAFLSGITRDSHLRAQQSQAPTLEEDDKRSSFIATPISRQRSNVSVGAVAVGSDIPSPPSTPVLEAHYTFMRTSDVCAESPSRQQLQMPVKHIATGNSNSLDEVVETLSYHQLTGSHSLDYAEHSSVDEHTSSLLHVAAKWPSSAEGAVYENRLPSAQYYGSGRSSRVVCITHTHTVASVFSILPYNKSRQDNPRERMRVRGNSFTLQMDLDGVKLGTNTEEVSLAFLLSSIWIPSELPPTASEADAPSLFRRVGSQRSKSTTDTTVPDKRSSTPTALTRYHVNPDVFTSDSSQLLRGDHRSPLNVILNYHPQFLDNEELFPSHKITTITPPGYRVSIIEYSKKSDIKKGLNDRFKETYPHIEVSLTKLRKMKRKMHEIAVECQLDFAAVSYAYVYFEKLVLMGKVQRSVRRPVAGVCLLLAAKFILDLKKQEISDLIDEITDSFRVPTHELLFYEFPVLAILQFSLLTPDSQARPHYDRLVRGNLHHGTN